MKVVLRRTLQACSLTQLFCQLYSFCECWKWCTYYDCYHQFVFLSETQSITCAVSKTSAHWNDGYLNIHHFASSNICFLLYFTATWQSRWRYFLCLHNLWNVLISINFVVCFKVAIPMELIKNLSLSLPRTFINIVYSTVPLTKPNSRATLAFCVTVSVTYNVFRCKVSLSVNWSCNCCVEQFKRSELKHILELIVTSYRCKQLKT